MKRISILALSSALLFLGSCGNSKEKIEEIEEAVTNQSKHQDISSVDFYAVNENEDWKLSITFDGKIVFTDDENDLSFVADKNEKQVAQGADVVTITAGNATHILRVNIDIAECDNYGKQVNIMLRKVKEQKGKDYSGCGYYRGAPMLHDIWALEKINGEKASADEFPKELPAFEFNLVTKKMSGFAGCNQVNGDIYFKYNKMIIDPLASTRMYCGEASHLEQQIISVLKSEPIYSFNGLMLTFESVEGSITLKKVD